MSKTSASRKKTAKPTAGGRYGALTAWMRQHLAATVAAAVVAGMGLSCVLARGYAVTVGHFNDTAARHLAERHFSLPADERPIVTTVKDVDSLSLDIPFLAEAENGDKLFVYQQNQLAVLYRPSSDKIITIGPLTDD